MRLATLGYASGLSAHFEVLEAQQPLFPAEIALARRRRDERQAVVNLYRALGGGGELRVPSEPAP
jgi:outer membrane protein, multidrug efflux system